MKIEVSAPGKTILHGEHAVVYGKAAVAVSMSLKTTLTLIPQESKITLNFKSIGLSREWDFTDFNMPLEVSNLGPSEFDFPHLNEDIMKQLIDTFNLNGPGDIPESHKSAMLSFFYLFIYTQLKYKNSFQPCLVDVDSQLSIGSGMGSSASFSVCLSAAMLIYSGVINPPLTKADKNLINSWAYAAEKVFHGNSSGIDNSICTYGGAVLYENGKVSDTVEKIPNFKILLVNTKIPRNTKLLVEGVKKRHEMFPQPMDSIMDAINTISKKSWNILTKSNNLLNENGHLQALEVLITMNHHLLNALGVGHAKLNMIQDIAQNYSCSSKLTGGGGGGCAIVLIPPTEGQREDSIKSLTEALKECGFEVQNIILGCPGVAARVFES